MCFFLVKLKLLIKILLQYSVTKFANAEFSELVCNVADVKEVLLSSTIASGPDFVAVEFLRVEMSRICFYVCTDSLCSGFLKAIQIKTNSHRPIGNLETFNCYQNKPKTNTIS